MSGALDILKSRCDGKRACEQSVHIIELSDPCWGTYKYLQTSHECLPSIHLITCENSIAHLDCDYGRVISVNNAYYGRSDVTTCSHQRFFFQLLNTDCSTPTSIVAERCNGRNSCTIAASNSVFGDPCFGTVKYLEVAYVCQ